MAALTTITAITLAGVSVGSQVYAHQQQREAAKKQEKANEIQNRIQERRAQRERINQMRQARIAAAGVANLGAATGLGGSSGIQGQIASVQSQLGTNINFLEQNMADARRISTLGSQASDALGNAAIAQSIGGVSMGAFNAMGGAAKIDAAFASKTNTTTTAPTSSGP